MSLLVFPLIGYAVTGSAALAGLATAAVFAGTALTRLPVGALVDRWPRDRVLFWANLVAAATYASLGLAALGDALTLAHLIVGGLVGGACESFIAPATSAAIRTVVARERLPDAYARLEARRHAAQLIGPPLGGALFSVAHGLPFLIDAASYAGLAGCVLRLRTPLPAPAGDAGRSVRRDVAAGLRFVWGETAIRAMMLWGAIVNFGGIVVLVVVTLRLIRAGVHPAAIGAVETTAAVAALAGSLFAPALVRRIRTGRLTLVSGAVVAVSVVPMAWTTQVLVLGALLALGAVLMPANNSAISAYLAARTPDRMQGRMNSAAGFIAEAPQPLAPLLAGVLLVGVGGVAATLIGAGCVALSLVPVAASREVRTLGRPDEWAEAPQEPTPEIRTVE